MKNVLILIILLFICGTTQSQDSFSSVEERMTGKEFMATGLNKLSEEELTALNHWLRGHSVATLENRVARSDGATISGGATISSAATSSNASAGGDKRGLEGVKTNTDTITSRLIGEFSGWDGETIFKLENGMVWQQEETDYFTIKPLVNPVVTIKSGMFNSWRLSVGKYNKSIEVNRIK